MVAKFIACSFVDIFFSELKTNTVSFETIFFTENQKVLYRNVAETCGNISFD
jgi:hypothetical protein